ncbi:hypothetical protein ACWDV7_38690, partial [Streptomyces sp. NPDC003362]
VTLAGDGIAKVEGLPSAMANELLKFEDGTLGLSRHRESKARSTSDKRRGGRDAMSRPAPRGENRQ